VLGRNDRGSYFYVIFVDKENKYVKDLLTELSNEMGSLFFSKNKTED